MCGNCVKCISGEMININSLEIVKHFSHFMFARATGQCQYLMLVALNNVLYMHVCKYTCSSLCAMHVYVWHIKYMYMCVAAWKFTISS